VTLFKRGRIFWSYIYVDGIRHRKSTGTGNRRQAETVDQKHKEDLNLKRHLVPQLNLDMTFDELSAKFIASGVKAYHLDRLTVLLPYFGEIPIGRITKATAKDYRRYRHSRKSLTEATINRDLQCLRHILFWSVDEGILPQNPLSRMPMERERKKRRPILSLDEEGALLTALALHMRPIVVAALDTGMRRGELMQQKWEDVDFGRKLLSVTHSKTPEGEAREIPLTQRVFDLLWGMREDHGLLFTYKGKAIQRPKTAWKTALIRSGIRVLRFHDLRHTFNTRLLEAGVMQEVRKALMGHSSGEDVHATYTHVELPMKREAIQKLEAWRELQMQRIESQSQTKGGELIPWKKSSTS